MGVRPRVMYGHATAESIRIVCWTSAKGDHAAHGYVKSGPTRFLLAIKWADLWVLEAYHSRKWASEPIAAEKPIQPVHILSLQSIPHLSWLSC
ncbi:hypothetical protein CRG98_014254 [Punica granatum]|uniref:Uncharacterized protein n=1 Tax=Punica granatum TaxID=22663 RepID=A0A2I0KA03_PUNGR|nr:hypothetical protein CRG98_014254 [Punica granatum]